MKFSLSWLKDHLKTDAPLTDITDTMVQVGLEVEEVDNPAERLSAISVGHILTAEKHPDADKLKICRVETKEGEQQIVCGAPNARAGLKVAYAPVGTYIPGIDITLSKAKIRGVESFGMLCSASELELGEDHAGIMELDAQAKVGTALADLLQLDDPVIDFEVTPNRPDTNGVDGVARDLAAAGLGERITPQTDLVEGTFPLDQDIVIEDETLCPAFAGRIVKGVKNTPSPQWLQDRLRSIGLRPINALVDITNYISYDRARPLHVYDVSKLTGAIHIRHGRQGEKFLALDGKEYAVDESMCVIADEKSVLGLGGVMGGKASGCTEDTTDVFVECALFDALTTARTGRKTGIVSDARYRFERGVDPQTVETGMALATQLILDLCGGTASEVTIAGTVPPWDKTVDFPPAEVLRLTGMDIPDSQKEDILESLGFDVKRGGVWSVKVPSFRPDIAGKADLVEEIARIHGLHHLPTEQLPPLEVSQKPKPAMAAMRQTLSRETLFHAGYHEAITWAFCDEKAATLFGGATELTLANPISADLSMMRPSALPNLLLSVANNVARGADKVRLFEIGGGYTEDTPQGQSTVLSAVSFGTEPKAWDEDAAQADIYALKALALTALDAMGVSVGNLTTHAKGPDFFHPGRKGSLGLGPKTVLAHFGEIHPMVLKKLDVPGPVVAMEIFFDAIPAPRAKSGKTKPPLRASNLMPLTRDFAFLVEDGISAEALIKAIRGADKKLITDVRLFDVYRGKGVPEGQQSLAIEVALQPMDKTLTDDEIEAISERIIQQAQKSVGATLRG